MKFTWRAVQARSSFYAKATIYKNGLQIELSMHRFVARTPWGMICHHINGNSLDNRACNLKNWDKLSHHLHHANNKLRKKFAIDPDYIRADHLGLTP